MALKDFLVALALIALVQAASVSQDERIRYDNYSVFSIKYETQEQGSRLRSLMEDENNFKHWGAAKDELHLMVSPGALSQFETEIQRANLSAEVLISNVQELIDSEQEADPRARADGSFGWRKYNTLAEIYAWLDGILAAYPTVTEEFIVGQSYEGRTIRGIKISYKSGNPGVFIESNIHGNEWITSATATWLINQFLSSQDPLIRQMVEGHDWYIVPVFNVDGFVYSHTKDRMWRKTRQPSADSKCFGVDPNRNFNVRWNESDAASWDPCAWSYGGPHALSEPEVQAMTDLIINLKDKINVLLAFHSYSQALLSPYGHSSVEVPPNFDDMMAVAKAYADAVKKLPYGTVFQYGSSAGLLYPVTGATKELAYQEGIHITYTVEFRDTGHYGFILPPVHIIPNAEEALAGIMAMLEKAEELGYMKLKTKFSGINWLGPRYEFGPGPKAEIYAWLDDILAAYPVITEAFVVGQSYEGRAIRGIKISYKSGNPGVFIESNIHAREWITSATATWLINQFLTSSDELVRQLAESHDWYIVPVLNVDGFVYTHEKDRMWRKTRQPSDISKCIGVNPTTLIGLFYYLIFFRGILSRFMIL